MKITVRYNKDNYFVFCYILLMLSMIFGIITIPVFLILFILKILELIDYSWWLVTLPIYYPIPLCIIGLILDFIRHILKK